MTITAFSRSACTGIAFAAAMAVPSIALAQDEASDIEVITQEERQDLPPDLRTAPVVQEVTDTTIGSDGVETITRTRRIQAAAPIPVSQAVSPVGQTFAGGYAPTLGPAPGAVVFDRAQWLEECERRTSGRSNREKGGIIGGLLGAIAGGIIGNRVDDGNRLAGTLIGVGTGGIAGVLLGNLIGGGRDRNGEYDCQAALDSYLSQYSNPGTRIAARTIPAPVYGAPIYSTYAAPAYAYAYAPPAQVVYVPIQYEQQQRVVVRETVREEVVPGASRTIPAPPPVRELRPIKGN